MRTFSKLQLNAVKLGASNKDPRDALRSLHFDGNSTVATCGHKLIRVTGPENTKAQDWPANSVIWSEKDQTPFTVPREIIEKAIKNIPKPSDCRGMPILENVAIGWSSHPEGPDSITLQTTDLENPQILVTDQVDGSFPRYKDIIPDTTDYIRVGVSAKYLRDIADNLSKFDKDQTIILKFDPDKTQNRPLVLEAENRDGYKAEVVLMPVRI